jgi:FkbM family methyltransferase
MLSRLFSRARSLRELSLTSFKEGRLAQSRLTPDSLGILVDLTNEYSAELLKYVSASRAQIWQDLFVLGALEFKRGGFFVEFGAADGLKASNTFLLEKLFGWGGILAEPARAWNRKLMANRNCAISTKLVWSQSGKKLRFRETSDAMLSTLSNIASSDMHAEQRGKGRDYLVETISLTDLLEEHGAPRSIDYLSVDTEGSEQSILGSFDFNKFHFKVVTVEHNFSAQRSETQALLSSNGYQRVHCELSSFDDWYLGPRA